MQSIIRSPHILLLGLAGLGGACLEVSRADYQCERRRGELECWRPDTCGNDLVEDGERCDDGNTTPGDGCSATCRDDEPPRVEVLFPSGNSFSDARKITVRGTATDESEVQEIRVNGSPAILLERRSSPGEADVRAWQVELPVTFGENRFTIESEDSFENIQPNAAEVVVQSKNLGSPSGVVFLEDKNQALIVDEQLDALVTVDLATGDRSIFGEHGEPRFLEPSKLVLDAAAGRVLVVDAGLDALVSVDLTSGERRILSDSSTGSGPSLQLPVAMALDREAKNALVVDVERMELIRIELGTGNRQVVSDLVTGEQHDLRLPTDVLLDEVNNQALILDTILQAVVGVDLDTGTRQILVHREYPPCPVHLQEVYGMAFDAQGRLMIVDWALDTLIQIDLSSSPCKAETVAGPSQGTGPALDSPVRVALARSRESNGAERYKALIIDRGLAALLSVDLVTRERRIVENARVGSGDSFYAPIDVALDVAHDRALVVDKNRAGLVSVNLQNGARMGVSDHEIGDGLTFKTPLSVTVDEGGERALVADFIDGVISVDLATGDRALLSGAGPEAGPSLPQPLSVALDRAEGQVLSMDYKSKALMAVKLDSGERRILSDANTGSGPSLATSLGMVALDESHRRVLVTQIAERMLMSIDLQTGDRTVVSSSQRGAGPVLALPGAMGVGPGGNWAVVVDHVLRALVRVDLESGDRRIVSEPSNRSSIDFKEPRGLALYDDGERALLVDDGTDALYLVDLATGERVLISR